jgi:hypothetical protein
MHMGSAKLKTQIYLLVFCLVMSLVMIAVMRFSQGANTPEPATAADRLRALERSAPGSPDMSRFLQREKAAREANQEATDMAR